VVTVQYIPRWPDAMNKDDSNAERNIKRVLACVYAGREYFLDLFGLMKPTFKLNGTSTTVHTRPPKI
jgi:hypothetical protein